MAFLKCVVLVLFTFATASQVTPIEKVISLLQGMKADVEKEGIAEAQSYDKFACFCRDTTKTKATSVTTGQDNIDKLSAEIAEKTATKAADESKVQGLKTKKEELSASLEETVSRCAKEKAEYEALAADLNKAISSIRSAIKSMADKKTAMASVKAASAFIEVDMTADLKQTLELADAMGLIKTANQKAFLQGFSDEALLQGSATVDPADAGYKYASQDIVDLLESLKKDFTDEKKTLDTENGKSTQACSDLNKSTSGKIESNGKETKSTSEKVEKLSGEVAVARGSLVEAQELMKDDQLYLKDLTSRCETRAKDWDQRSGMRNGEIEALSTALKVLGDKVQPADAVNKRAALVKAKAVIAKVAAPTVKRATSFLQRISAHSQEIVSQEAKEQVAKMAAVMSIKDAGLLLKSPVLTALAMRAAADPFKKVKELIQGLVERLITESAAEATKKGFCDTEMGKATKDRDFRWMRVQKLTAQIVVGAAKEDALTEEIASLTTALEALDKAVKESTGLRATEKTDNAKTIQTATDGLKAVNEALLILKTFYKEAAKASFLQASPVDDDTAGAGFSGSYSGKQDSSNAILGLLQTIASDFERTIRATETSEDESARSYVKFQRASKVDIAGKTTKKELDAQDLKTTKNKLAVDRADMKTNMDLVDDAVKTLMELRPTCVDTGMSYKERVQKREDEVAALKKALCMLDTEKVEAECK